MWADDCVRQWQGEGLMAFEKVQTGPMVGNPPSLEWLALGQLQVDPAYQRATDGHLSRRIIVGMVKFWDWKLCQPLVVTRRADNSLFVLDGQHRLAGARERGDIPHLPCVVIPAISAEEEAAAFVNLNTARQKLSQADIFVGMLAAGNAEAVLVEQIMRETGWRMVRHANTAAYKAGDLACAPKLAKLVKSSGEASVRNALAALREAYPETPVRNSSRTIEALVRIYARGLLLGIDPDCLIAALAAFETPEDIMMDAHDLCAGRADLSWIDAMIEVIIAEAREQALEVAA
jgi:hypothetical protein